MTNGGPGGSGPHGSVPWQGPWERPPQPPTPGRGPGSRSGRPALILLTVAIVLVAAITVVLYTRDDDQAAADAVVLEPVDHTLRDDYFGDLDLAPVGERVGSALGDDPPATTDEAAATLAETTAAGTEPGLYGGTRDDAVCDVDRLVAFLTDPANADKAASWAAVQGIDPSGIADFVAGLTAVRLNLDTRVTNHGFRDGRATPFQSVLQAGTAVLVDETGVPRAKCNCGNPLAEPAPLSEPGSDGSFDVDDIAQNPGDAWPEFQPGQVVVVTGEGGSVGVGFEITDKDSGERFVRQVGTNGEDDADATETPDDEPPEEPDRPSTTTTTEVAGHAMEIMLTPSFNTNLSLLVSGGNSWAADFGSDEGDICSAPRREWETWDPATGGGAEPGTYEIQVFGIAISEPGDVANPYNCGPGDFTITVTVDGTVAQTFTGTALSGEWVTFTFTLE